MHSPQSMQNSIYIFVWTILLCFVCFFLILFFIFYYFSFFFFFFVFFHLPRVSIFLPHTQLKHNPHSRLPYRQPISRGWYLREWPGSIVNGRNESDVTDKSSTPIHPRALEGFKGRDPPKGHSNSISISHVKQLCFVSLDYTFTDY